MAYNDDDSSATDETGHIEKKDIMMLKRFGTTSPGAYEKDMLKDFEGTLERIYNINEKNMLKFANRVTIRANWYVIKQYVEHQQQNGAS
jgi:hypothetical protein